MCQTFLMQFSICLTAGGVPDSMPDSRTYVGPYAGSVPDRMPDGRTVFMGEISTKFELNLKQSGIAQFSICRTAGHVPDRMPDGRMCAGTYAGLFLWVKSQRNSNEISAKFECQTVSDV